MGLEEFSGTWRVGSSGRAEIRTGSLLSIDTTGGGTGWTLATQNGPIGQQTGQDYQEGGTHGAPRIYCMVTIASRPFYFEAVLAKNDNRVLYGHLYLASSLPDPGGEGAVGGWSAEKQGTW